jgi:PAS domain S-box-containing protein
LGEDEQIASGTASVVSAFTIFGRAIGASRRTVGGRVGSYVLAVLVLAAAYYAAAKIGLRLAYLHGTVTALWPPVGVGIAALARYGARLWPGIVIGDLLAGDYSSPLGTVLGQTAGNTLEVLLAAVLLRRLVGDRIGLTRVAEVFALVVCAALGTLVSATFGAMSLRLGDVITRSELAEVWRTWWLSDFSGALVVTPVLLSWTSPAPFRLGRREAIEGVVLLAILVALAELPSQRDVPYVVFPVLIWAALRFGPRGASLSLLVASSLTVLNTAHNAGPFVRESITDSLLSTQLFLAAAALTTLVLAAVTAERATAAAALRANEERLESVVGSMAEGLVVRDARGVITECNAAAEQITGVSRERLLGARPADVMAPAVDERGRRLSSDRLLGDRAIEDGTSDSGLVARVTRPDGTAAWVSVSSGAVRDAAGRPEGAVTTLSDITERRAAEERLIASERATRTLAEEQSAMRRIAMLVAAEAPPRALFAQVTEEVGRLLGAPSARIVRYEGARGTIVGGWTEDGGGLPVGSRIPLNGDTAIARVRHSGTPERIDGYEGVEGELAGRLRARGYRTSVAAPVRVAGSLWGVLVASAHDPDDLHEGAERRLCDVAELVAQALANADAREMLAASRARIVEAGDSERRRLERNLHDGAQQRLVALALQLRLIRTSVERDPAAASRELESASVELREALEELRELARGIHPAVLTDRGLEPAVSALADRSPVPVEVVAVPHERLPAPVEAAAYYIIAEAITNVAKYAHASHVAIAVRHAADSTLVEVSDDGVGGANPADGSGLRGIADRIEALDGRLHVTSPLGHGTRIRAEIPRGARDTDAP